MPEPREPRVGDVWRHFDGHGYERRRVQDVADGHIFWTDGWCAGQTDAELWTLMQEEGRLRLVTPAGEARSCWSGDGKPAFGEMDGKWYCEGCFGALSPLREHRRRKQDGGTPAGGEGTT